MHGAVWVVIANRLLDAKGFLAPYVVEYVTTAVELPFL
jgi:hypothetical protein